MPTLQLGDARGEVHSLPRVSENFELFLNFFPKDDALVIEATYSTVLFSEPSIVSWLDVFTQILSEVIVNPDIQLGAIKLSNGLEQFAAQTNDTRYSRKFNSMIEAVALAAEKSGEAQALVCGDRRMSYLTLWQRVESLAAYLHDEGVREGQVVGICCERSENLVVSTLALHRLGAAYLPLDPSFPVERLRFVYEDAGAVAALVDDKGVELLKETACNLLDIQGQASNTDALPTLTNNPDRLAYIIYTSGSTGKPKGVEVSWGSMINFLEAMLVKPGFDSSNTLLAVTTLAFDISVLELFLPLLAGGTIVIAESEDLKDGEKLAKLIETYDVDVMQSTPATFQLLLESSWGAHSDRSLKALCGGEPLSPVLAEKMVSRVRELWNMYGPTEATVWVTRKLVQDPKEEITIGKAIENVQILILDDSLNALPMSVPGELCIAGDNLAIAYHGRPDLTDAAFVEHPEFGRIYRTGDLAKWNTQGEVVHLGRIDDQVKIRGYRIELGEIEKAISDTELVNQVAVIVKGDADADRKLVACCANVTQSSDTEAAIKSEIRKVLPGYMVPQHFVYLEALPLTNSGKVDRKALRNMSFDLAVRQEASDGGLPSSESEKYLAELWSDIVDIDAVYVEDNFFDIGGHSVLAAQFIAQVAKDRGIQLPFNVLISSTLEQIAATCLDDTSQRNVGSAESKAKKGWLSSLFGKR